MSRAERRFRQAFARVYRWPERRLELTVLVAREAVLRGFAHPMSAAFAWPGRPPARQRRGK
jgi:hypothetical protein